MKISIIIPIYNVSQYIKRCINSVLVQTYTEELECILVNDCTPDNSMEIVYSIIKTYEGPIKIKILNHTQNKGLSAARNTGIRHSTGDYLYFLDSDDEITPNCIEVLADFISKYKGIDIVQGNIIVTNKQFEWLESSQYNFPEYTTDNTWIKDNMLTTIPVTAWNKLIKKSFILSNDLYFKEGIIHEDEHWKYFAHKHIHSIAFCNIPTYYYYMNTNSIMSSKHKDKSLHSLICIFKEYIPTIEKKNEYKNIILYIANMQKEIAALPPTNSCFKEFQDFLKEQVRSKTIPMSIKFSFLYMLFPSQTIKFISRLFFRRSYKIICLINKL